MTSLEPLEPLVRKYFVSSGFRILEERRDCLVADKLVFGQEWCGPSPEIRNRAATS
jgi:hypothetical protein